MIAAGPAAARRRAERARRQARVECYGEGSGGTAALAGRDLPVAGALAAGQRIDATARALKQAGVAATLAQLRAAVFLALLTGGDPHTFLPPTETEDHDAPASDQAPSPTETTSTHTQPGSDHHAVQVRQKECFNPVCARPAANCDDDHTIPYDQSQALFIR